MEREVNLPASKKILQKPISEDGDSSSLLPPRPDSLRHVQAAFKHYKPLGMVPSNLLRARRVLVPQTETSKNGSEFHDAEKSQNVVCRQGDVEQEMVDQRKSFPDDSSLTLPSVTGTMSSTCNENMGNLGLQRDESKPAIDRLVNSESSYLDCKNVAIYSSSHGAFQHNSIDVPKKVQFSFADNARSAFPGGTSQKSECSTSDPLGAPSINDQDLKQRGFHHSEMSEMSMRTGGGTHFSGKTGVPVHDRHHDSVHPMTQSSVAGSSCATTSSVHSMSAPMQNSATYNPRLHRDSCSHMEIDPLEEFNLNPQPRRDSVVPSGLAFHSTSAVMSKQTAVSTQVSSSAPETSLGVQNHSPSKGQGSVMKERDRLEDGLVGHAKAVRFDEKSTKGKGLSGDASDMQSQASLIRKSSSYLSLESSQASKSEKATSGRGSSASRKKNYDPDVFFKVNGKLYQKLGKIGSGGSSEVHKVISSDCTIYALKKIKLKGRDYSTAHGFCQEIVYLNRLKGKNNIIQLIDYEVTDKTLLEEVMSGSTSSKDSRIRDDGFIYMVLEYGEIDLAHMLSQKWKEMDSSSWKIDENWLRFYWQQMLQAVNTIHEERIVHSDLKPANFLLVKGSLKLIDFGIARAIMSDTTNIQRDAQVGTLNYMSPEAFMWNEEDETGNIIKCGRPSDIWSLGCILYQMVYGRTPFSEYKTFWAKFKVITDRNHEIKYDVVSNPLLLDLMKKCLAWDRQDRWRIPELLQHPFLVPPIPSQLTPLRDQHCKLLMQMVEIYGSSPEVSRLCYQLHELLANLQDPRI
ncbi:serine/threonine-protein kinase MPS1-like [Tasmannia lanceolata]|uniref:serine/threonine-protein kinase MPS1-like n=1 Tax=Tasmannia lanceolata TaxID=3420 RepID=UPI004063D9C5